MTGDDLLGVEASAQFIGLPSVSGFTEMDMNDIVHYVVGSSRSYLSERKMSLTVAMCRELPPVRGNEEQLYGVLYALLLRAEGSIATAAGTTGMIHIRTWTTAGEVHMRVSDNGASIRDSVNPDPCMNLTECAEIISDHGGKMYSWRPYTYGTSYTITLPTVS